MSDGVGKYTFLPWLRQGISTETSQVEGMTVPLRATIHVDVKIGGGAGPGDESHDPIGLDFGLAGPGDIRNFDARAVARHWPRPDVFEVEPNYFPLLELFPADIAWRYTPARANDQDRLRPWLALIVLRNDEIETIETPTGERPFAILTTKAGAPLPRVDQLWAWTHGHVEGADGIDVETLKGIIDNESHRVVTRLLCPRRLDQQTAYTAFLVPALEAARLSVLGQSVAPTFDAMTPAWRNDGAPVQLPIFYRWRFQTSDTGDFASLAKRIVAQALPSTAGGRPMDVSRPGMSLPAAAATPLVVESALRALDAVATPWQAAERQTWTDSLAALLNLPEQRLQQPGAPRTLTPPLYGRWHAATALLDPAAPPPWFQDLNADPRTRVAAALGTLAVQRDMQQLLAGAWAQVDAVREANAQLRQAQLAREAALRLYARHVAPRPPSSLPLFTQPLHARLLMQAPGTAGRLTVRALVLQSPLRVGVLHPGFARIARPLGPVVARQGRALSRTPPTMVDRVNSGEVAAAPPPKTPTGMVTPTTAGAEIAPPWLTPEIAEFIAKIPLELWASVDVILSLVVRLLPQPVDPLLRRQVQAFLEMIRQGIAAGGSPGDEVRLRLAVRNGALTPEQIKSARARPGFVAQELQPDGTVRPISSSSGAEDTRFRVAAATAFGEVNAAQAPGDVLRPIDMKTTEMALSAAIYPGSTVAATFRDRLGVLTSQRQADPLDPVMAAPSFSQPMYKPLFDISPEWILAGLGQMPQEMASVAHPNERFIESYVLGLNDEMGRALLFNEYPTDQRGSYFRQFWDVNGVESPAPDIKPIVQWKTSALGLNSTRPGIDAYLVLVVRAELLRRYPNTIVYAMQAQWNPDGSRSVPATSPVELHPDFQGSLGTGAGFWGFNLTAANARGAPTREAGLAGWYFALQEHTSEPRFGLEPAGGEFAASPGKWEDLAWSDLAADAGALSAISYIDLAASLPNVGHVADAANARWPVADGTRASDLAYITWREPVRLLVHASRMIPSDA
jgi:hypothetical protein